MNAVTSIEAGIMHIRLMKKPSMAKCDAKVNHRQDLSKYLHVYLMKPMDLLTKRPLSPFHLNKRKKWHKKSLMFGKTN